MDHVELFLMNDQHLIMVLVNCKLTSGENSDIRDF